MVTPEERDQLITTYCATFGDAAHNIARRCDALLAETDELFSAEQKTDIKRIHNAVQKFLSLVETARQFAVTQGWASRESREFDEFMARWIHDLRTPLNLVIGFAQLFLEGGMGPLNDRQQEAMEYICKLGQGLLSKIDEMLNLSRQASA